MKTFVLNGIRLGFDEQTGALASLYTKSSGEFIKKPSGLIDIAWPKHLDYEVLRAIPCGKYFPEAPKITRSKGQVKLTYYRLPQNIYTPDFPQMEGRIKAVITIKECEDGRSLSFSAKVTNRSKQEVAQVLFPNLEGLAPVDGEEHTRFTTMLFHTYPFIEQKSTTDSRDSFFASSKAVAGQYYRPSGLMGARATPSICGRWFDYGGLHGGFCFFRKHWGWGPEDKVYMGANDLYWVKVDNISGTCRLSSIQYVNLKKNESYETGEYIITPHAGGWQQGAFAYKAWIKQNVHRAVPVPKSSRERLGFRTIWVGTGVVKDPEDCIWPYKTYPEVAKDMIEHGLDSLNLWGAHWAKFPITKESFFEEYGGPEGFKKAVKECNKLGVDIYILVSMVQIWYEDAIKRGLKVGDGWSETLKSIPVFRAPYMWNWKSVAYNKQDDPWYTENVMKSLRFLRDEMGCPTVCWDQYLLFNGLDSLHDIFVEYRKETQPNYPEAQFSGESTNYFESELDVCDTTWTWYWWRPTTDLRAYMYLVDTLRPNINIDSDPLRAKYIFMDNLMMNVFPSKPESLNGSAFIRDYPEFSATLKKLASMRKKYIQYMAYGETLGDCILREEISDGDRINSYLKDGSMLVYAVKGTKNNMTLKLDLTPYMNCKKVKATVISWDGAKTEEKISPKGILKLKGEKDELITVLIKPE